MTPKRSMAWEHFVDKGNYIGECQTCKTLICYKSGVSNLTKHIRRKHLDLNLVPRAITKPKTEPLTPKLERLTPKSNTEQGKRLRSVAWDYFVNKGNSIGECMTCKALISFKAGVSNLTKHVQRKHLLNLEAPDTPAREQLQTTSSNASSESCPSVYVPAKISSRNNSSSFTLPGDCNEINKDIDDHIMNLFIWDMQPFTIVEDKGFRQLIKFAFPDYVLPTRNNFANILLPEQYEAVKLSTKSLVHEDAQTICLTTDIWTSKNNDSYLAVTGHYIDKDFVLRSVLLECKVLENSYTGLDLAEELQNIVEEWDVADRVMLIVSDNGANIKSAITSLQWKHFSCYAHTFNLVMKKVFESTAVVYVLNKIKAIVSHFERSDLAWNKLKKYQRLANIPVKRLIQDVATRWNSSFYMLQRFVELKDQLESTISDLRMSNIISLTEYEWEVCESLLIVLQPCEEVTRELSAQKYANGSSILPITVGLISALNEIVDPSYQQSNNISAFPEEVEICRQELLSDITTRFGNLETNEIFTTCMFLDPRYKLYFENQYIADKTKKRVIAMVTALINETSEESLLEDSVPTNTPSLIWNCYKKNMQNIRPERTASSRAIIEVQRYLDDTLLNSNLNPLEWWRSHQTIYPYLSKLVRTKLNAIATSIPCERLYSSAGTILTERRNRLGSRNLQQLMFLQQNKN